VAIEVGSIRSRCRGNVLRFKYKLCHLRSCLHDRPLYASFPFLFAQFLLTCLAYLRRCLFRYNEASFSRMSNLLLPLRLFVLLLPFVLL
jgi:hypothetical protein